MDLNQIKSELRKNYELVFQKLGIEYDVMGDNLYSTCPIHGNSDNPRAFSYSIQRGYWKCWTRNCQDDHKSDIFGLIGGVLSQQNGSEVAFKDVLKWSCDVLQISGSIKKSKKTLHATPDPYEDLVNIINIFKVSNKNEQEKLLHLDRKKWEPSSYFLSRGFDKQTLEHFDVCENVDIQAMKDRAVATIYNDDGGSMVGLIGRSVKEYKIPKYLIFPKGFDKKFYLYNYHRAIERATQTSALFIVEGQGDVWRLYEAGVYNAVGIFGKDIAKEQETKIHQMPVTNLIVLTDNDQAGREAKTQIKRQFNRSHNIYFPKFDAKDIGDMSIKDIQDKILIDLKGLY
jgi:5S rRNA maturation endonuclease (ribonuclease M5)